jgi:hypothetical protein
MLTLRYILGYVLNLRHILGYVFSLRHIFQNDEYYVA